MSTKSVKSVKFLLDTSDTSDTIFVEIPEQEAEIAIERIRKGGHFEFHDIKNKTIIEFFKGQKGWEVCARKRNLLIEKVVTKSYLLDALKDYSDPVRGV